MVVGGSGLIGRAVVKLLSKADLEIVGMSRYNCPEDVSRYSLNWIYGDISTEEGANAVLRVCQGAEMVTIVFCCGNHGETNSIENQIKTIETNLIGLSRIWNLIQNNQGFSNAHLVVCSSLMGSLPDRHFPFYAGSKAGVDHFIRSLNCRKKDVLVTSLILGPVGTSKSAGMTSPIEVAEQIYRLIQKPERGMVYYPGYLRFLSVLSKLAPNFLESILFKYRKART